MAKRVRASDKDGSEEYVKGRRAGVDNTYGEDHDGVAERTLASGKDSDDGGGEDGLVAAARNLYQAAVHNRGDKLGDKALTER